MDKILIALLIIGMLGSPASASTSTQSTTTTEAAYKVINKLKKNIPHCNLIDPNYDCDFSENLLDNFLLSPNVDPCSTYNSWAKCLRRRCSNADDMEQYLVEGDERCSGSFIYASWLLVVMAVLFKKVL